MTQPRQIDVPGLDAARHELKATAPGYMLPQLRMWLRLHWACFFEEYPPRQINNAYFDTSDLASYCQNLGGLSDRSKVRLRWYGATTREVDATLEVKRKRNNLGWKLSQRIVQPFNLELMTWQEILQGLRSELSTGLRAYLDCGRSPTAIIQYQREYYVTFDGRVRATLDHGLEVFDQRPYDRPNLRFRLPMNDTAIVEFKSNSRDAELLAQVTATMPIRLAKSSKYAEGISGLLGY